MCILHPIIIVEQKLLHACLYYVCFGKYFNTKSCHLKCTISKNITNSGNIKINIVSFSKICEYLHVNPHARHFPLLLNVHYQIDLPLARVSQSGDADRVLEHSKYIIYLNFCLNNIHRINYLHFAHFWGLFQAFQHQY